MSIETHNLRTFSCPALQGLNMSVRNGNLVCVLGTEASGKSRLRDCILGLERRYQGDIYICGENLRDYSRRKLRRSIGYIPGSSRLSGYSTVLKAVQRAKNSRTGAQNAIEQMGLSSIADRRIRDLDPGTRHLVMLGAAQTLDERFIIADDPGDDIEQSSRDRFLSRLRRLSRDGKTVLYFTESIDDALAYADYVVAVEEGRGVAAGNPREVFVEEDTSEEETAKGTLPWRIPSIYY